MELITSTEAASRIGVTSQTVTRLIHEERLQAEKIGGRYLIKASDVSDYLAQHNLVPAPVDHTATDASTHPITALSFFSGALGLDLGMERAGVRAQLYCENDTRCRMTIESNRPNVGLASDIRMLTTDDIWRLSGIDPRRGIDIMFGGPPCQAFSTAGARRAFDDERGNVFITFLKLASELRPRYVVIENVRGLLSCAYPLKEGSTPVRGGALKRVLTILDDMGYGISFNLYDAAAYGAPQTRERVVIIAKRDGRVMPWLTPTHCDDPRWNLPPYKTLKDALEDVVPPLHYSEFSPKHLKFLALLDEGQCWRDLPADVQEEAMGKAFRLTGGKTGFYRRLRFDRPCPTLVTSPTMPATMLCHPTENRPLAVEEYKAIQGFPADWVVCGNIQDQYRQIGNAVPLALGEAIGKAIVEDIAGTANEDAIAHFKKFPRSRYKHTSEETWDLC